jgi:zinc transport system permease protein
LDALMHFGFLQRALVAGVFIGVACAVLGVFLVLRKDAMIGDGLSHVAFAGVALGLVLNVLPLAAALAVSVAGAFGIMRLKTIAGLHGDTAIGIFSSLGMAVGILLATMAGDFNVDLLSYLFGEVLAIEPFEVWLSLALAGLIIATVAANYSKLMFMTFDRETARVSGVAVGRLDGLLTVLTAVTVVLGMRVVGILLVAALVVIPAAAGLQVAGSFRKAIVISSAVSTASVVMGLVLALFLDIPASAAIVIVAFLVFGGLALFKGRKKGLL